jgi:hypothetical protein
VVTGQIGQAAPGKGDPPLRASYGGPLDGRPAGPAERSSAGIEGPSRTRSEPTNGRQPAGSSQAGERSEGITPRVSGQPPTHR